MQGSENQVDSPRGTYPAKVDEKGRLKLPTDFVGYLNALQAKKLFITTLDESTCKMYTTPVWNANLKRLNAAQDKATARQTLFLANHWGRDAEVDPDSGRVLLPAELRRKLGLENAQVFLAANDGVLNVYSEAQYQQELSTIQGNKPAIAAFVDDLGLQ